MAALLGFELLPRIRNWHDLSFYRPDAETAYEHIDTLFGDNVIDWGLIEKHWPDLLRAGISIREGRLSSVTLLRRLGNHSRRNRLYKALRELGRVIRTITLLRYLSEPELRDQIAVVTNRTEQFHNFSQPPPKWPHDGVPDNPRAWLITVAARRLTDLLRAEHPPPPRTPGTCCI